MLGQDLQRVLSDREVTALGRAELDVTDRDAVLAAVAGHDVVFNASAYTRVDDAETHEDEAYAINALGTEYLASAAAAHGARFVTVSTDYVFDGHATEPYAEDTQRDPINAYGRTKAAGEELALAAHPAGTFVVRTAWLYGAGGNNFARTMVKLAQTHETVSVVADRLGHDLRYSVDISKIRAELGYEPLVPFQQGLADVVQWYRDNRAWWEPLKARAALDS